MMLAVSREGAMFDEDGPRGHVTLLVRDGQPLLEVAADGTTVGTGQIATVARRHAWCARAERDPLAVADFSWTR